MTELSTNGAGALRVSRSCTLEKGADVLRTLGVNMVGGLELEATYCGGGCWFGIWDDDRVVDGFGLHNHLQSSGEHSMSRAHSRSTSSDNPSPALLSQCSVMTVTVQMDPYPFPPHVTLHVILKQVLKEEWHDLALDHTTDSSFLFPLPCHDSFSWTELEI